MAKSINGLYHAAEGGRAHCNFHLAAKPVLSADHVSFSRDKFCAHCFPHSDLPKFRNGGTERAKMWDAMTS